MRIWMKRTIVAATIAAVGLGAGSAIARGGDRCDGARSGKAAWHQMERGHMKERAGARLEQLESALALRDDQRAGWDGWKQSVTARFERSGEHRAQMRDGEQPQSALEKMERMEALGAARLESMAEMRKATEAFYGTLDEAQRKTFDEQFRMGSRGDGTRRGMGPRSSS